ncbi:MAG TPA: MATE family efflux transporter [Bacteroidales bacterium]|nr:MATE family efflux transporter [Bacteroidales bacterium]
MYSSDYRINTSLKQLVQLALPVIATSFMSMAYNFINMIFVGRLGSDAVAAVGSAGFFMNLSWGISSLLTVGAGIKVSHSIGEKNIQLSRSYVRSGLQVIILIAVFYYLILVAASKHLIHVIGLNNPQIEDSAAEYLVIIGLNILFNFQNLFFTSVFIGYGDSKTSFRINSTAVVLNMILDPVLIFIAGLGIKGAAIGTVLSQAVATVLFYRKLFQRPELNPRGVAFRNDLLKKIFMLGISPTIQRVSFTIIAISMARIISGWGPAAIAVQKVGIQIEAISYMTAGGFMSALSSISGKAYGARNFDKQWRVFCAGMVLAVIIGLFTSMILIAFPGTLFSLFLNDAKSLSMGREYLVILGYSQLFMCLELMATGAFFGWGKTNIPAITGITLTLLRIPMALAFIHFWRHSLSSVWWSISISSMAKGIILVALFIFLFKYFIRNQQSFSYETKLLHSGSTNPKSEKN